MPPHSLAIDCCRCCWCVLAVRCPIYKGQLSCESMFVAGIAAASRGICCVLFLFDVCALGRAVAAPAVPEAVTFQYVDAAWHPLVHYLAVASLQFCFLLYWSQWHKGSCQSFKHSLVRWCVYHGGCTWVQVALLPPVCLQHGGCVHCSPVVVQWLLAPGSSQGGL